MLLLPRKQYKGVSCVKRIAKRGSLLSGRQWAAGGLRRRCHCCPQMLWRRAGNAARHGALSPAAGYARALTIPNCFSQLSRILAILDLLLDGRTSFPRPKLVTETLLKHNYGSFSFVIYYYKSAMISPMLFVEAISSTETEGYSLSKITTETFLKQNIDFPCLPLK